MVRWAITIALLGLLSGCGGREPAPIPAPSPQSGGSPTAGIYRARFVGAWRGAKDDAVFLLNDDGSLGGDGQAGGNWHTLDNRRIEIRTSELGTAVYTLSADGKALTSTNRSTQGGMLQTLRRQ